jgi:A/G-specific adenine glycosylase
MLQQTRVEAGRDYFLRWMQALPDIEALANVSEQQLMKLWEGLGYYNRARNLKKAAGIVMEQYGGVLPGNFDALLALPGIGPYTAGAIGSIAFGLPVPAVDGNVLRVTARVLASYEDIAASSTKGKMEQMLKEVIPKDRPGDFNQAMMELGAVVCIPNGSPKCSICPVAAYCIAHSDGY